MIHNKRTSGEYLFESERLGFRYWEMEDREFYSDLCQNPSVMEFFPKCLSAEESYGEMLYLDDQLRSKGYGFWAGELKTTKELIGDIGIQNVPFDSFFTPAIEIGWRIHKDFWRQGFAYEGATRVLQYAQEKYLTNKIVSFTAKQNIPSQAVMKKLEMTYVGEFNHPRLEEDHPLCVHVLYEKDL